MANWLPRLVISLCFIGSVPAMATAASISQAYKSAGTFAEGTLVSIDDKDTSSVVAATEANSNSLVGVVIARTNATIALGDTDTTVQVASTGTVDAFVTDLNGEIKAGDKLTPSPFAGVAMKATAAARIIGTAKANMSTIETSTKDITDKSKKVHHAKVGLLPTILGVSTFDPATTKGKSLVPTALQNIANEIAGGREVAGWRIIVAIIILVIITILVFFLTYSSIRASIIAIGRNPLSAPAVYRSLFQLIGITLGLLLLALSTVYFLLRL